jgi:ribonuclease inhibitor
MKQYIIDGNHFSEVESFYKEVSQVFSLPDYFGNNLDALYDVLSDMEEPIEVIWQNSQKSKIDFSKSKDRPTFFAQVISTLQEVPHLTLTLE